MGNHVILFPCDLLWNLMGNHVILFPCDLLWNHMGNHVILWWISFRKFLD
jgi:hypothetical protein